jgi:two-component sensor histidine kinase
MAGEQPISPVWDLKHLRMAVEAAGIALWSWNVDTDRITMDEHGQVLWGMPPTGHVTFADLSAQIHPKDLDRVRAGFAATRAVVGAYEIDFRILVGDEVRWVSARGKGDDSGMVGRILFGVFLDVTGRKQAEEAHELLSGEMSHRVKNLLQIAAALTQLTSRSASTAEEMARDLSHRLIALGRAHELVRPTPGLKAEVALVALLGDLLAILLAPYDDTGDFQGRVRVSVPKIGVGEEAATTLALVVHELATNSLKYGALSVASGMLDVSCSIHEANDVVVVWTERGGPSIVPPVQPEGFGSKLMMRSMARQLGGSIAFNWSEQGVIVTLRMNMGRLAT